MVNTDKGDTMHLGISVPRSERPGEQLMLVSVSKYSTDSAGTLHLYRDRQVQDTVPYREGGYSATVQHLPGQWQTEASEFMTFPRGEFRRVLAADTREALTDLIREVASPPVELPARSQA